MPTVKNERRKARLLPRHRLVATRRVPLGLVAVALALAGCSSADGTSDALAGEAGAEDGTFMEVGDSGGDRGDGYADAVTEVAPAVAVPAAKVTVGLGEGQGQQVSASAFAVLRGAWDLHYDTSPGASLAEILTHIQNLKNAGINALFRYVRPRDITLVRSGASSPDDLGNWVTAARAGGLEVHLAFEPLRVDYFGSAPAAWIVQPSGGKPSTNLSNADAMNWEIESLRLIADRYHPDAFQLEEFYYHGALSPALPVLAGCSSSGQMCAINEFGRRAGAALTSVDSSIAIHVNVSRSFIETFHNHVDVGGFDPGDWMNCSHNGGCLLDGYVPQIYYDTASTGLASFKSYLASVRWGDTTPFEPRTEGKTSLIAGVELHYWKGTALAFNDTYALQQMEYAENAGNHCGTGLWATYAGGTDVLKHFASGLHSHLPAELVGTLGSTTGAELSDPTWVDGPGSRKALRFDGLDDRVTLPDAYAFDEYGSFTFATRLRLLAPSNATETLIIRGTPAADYGYFWLHRGSDPKRVYVAYADGTATPEVASEQMPIDDGAWHHLAVTQDRADRRWTFYLDGKAYGTSSYAVALPVTTGVVLLGMHPSGTQAHAFHGELTDVRWFRRTLTPAQVASMATQP